MMKHVILAVVSMLIAAGSPVLADTVGWWHFNGTPGADATSIPSAIDNDHPAVLQTVSGFPNAKFSAESRGEIPCGLDGSGNFVKYDGSSAGSVYLSVTNSTTGEVKGLWYKVSASDLFKTKIVDGETKRAAFTVEIISRHAAVNMPGPRGMNIAMTRSSSGFLFMFCGISSWSQFRADYQDTSNYISKVWPYDDSSDPFPFDGRWHHMAIVYDGEGTTKIYRDYVEKLSQSGKPLSEDAGNLVIGPGANAGIGADNMFTVDEVRISDTALPPSEFMHSAYSVELEDSFAYWTFDAPGMAGTDVGTEYGAVKTITGDPAFDLCGATYTNNVNGTGGFARNWDPNGDYQPRFSGDVKSAYVWDAASCRIANPANSTSVFFRHASEAGASQQSTIGSSLHTACLASPFPAASNITVECFLKTDKTFNGNVSGLFRLMPYPGPATFKACIDMVLGTTPRAIVSHAEGGSIRGGNVGDGDWHHVAMNYDISSGTSTVFKLWVDYQYIGMGERIEAVTFDWNSVYIALGASPSGYAYSGWIDELRISRGDIGEEHFLRAFTPRADLTGAWLVQTNATLTGAEWFSPDTSYLNARWNDGDVALADMGSKRLKLGGNTVAVDKSVAFSGVGGMTIPYAAFIGTNVFTVEANVRGSGTVFAKKRDGGTSWSVGSAANGKAELKVNDAATATSATLSDGRWHHVALVVDLASSNMATLYVDCAVAASASASAMVVDAGDLVLGEDFAGEMAGVRFSPGIVAPESFMVLRPPSGMVLIVR